MGNVMTLLVSVTTATLELSVKQTLMTVKVIHVKMKPRVRITSQDTSATVRMATKVLTVRTISMNANPHPFVRTGPRAIILMALTPVFVRMVSWV